MGLDDETNSKIANHLARLLKGSDKIYYTRLARFADPIICKVDWDIMFQEHSDKMNSVLHELEAANRAKFGPRSISVPWSLRIADLKQSYNSQCENFIALFKYTAGPGNLFPISLKRAMDKMKPQSSAGLPSMRKKKVELKTIEANFDELVKRKDPCIVFTRTTEALKTRNVWGYPLADTLFEMLFYAPLLEYQKTMHHRASLVSPDLVAQRITDLILYARHVGKMLYSVDFKAFDANVKKQYIVKAFDYFKSCYAPAFHKYLDYVCERMYSIGILCPSAHYSGVHGVPSGSTFTNEVDSVVQLGIASTCEFIRDDECQVQGDDGVYCMFYEQVPIFQQAFQYAGMLLEKTKSKLSYDYVLFCQNLYHIDYLKDGHIGGIYSTYRALNRLLFQERFVEYKRLGMRGRYYFAIRTLTILENCKYHPLFEEFVRFIVSKEQFHLELSEDSIEAYCNYLARNRNSANSLNHQYGSQVMGIRDFESYKLIQRIYAEEELLG